MFQFPNPIRQAIREQSKIGWLDMMEGAAAKTWQSIQRQYYKSKQIRKSSKKWMRGVLLQLHHVAWKQWNHRNKVNVTATQPQTALAEQLINEEISLQLTTRMHELMPGDYQRLNKNLVQLLSKSFQYKSNWLANVTAARQRYLRRQTNNAELIAQSRNTSRLYQYFIGGTL